MYVSHFALAQSACAGGNVRRAKEKDLLGRCDPDLRGWEWDRLALLSDVSIQTLQGREQGVYSVDFAPDGTHIVAGGAARLVNARAIAFG